jgi:ribonuclease HII
MNNNYPRNYIPNYNNFNQQNMYDQIDSQIAQLQQMREQIKNNIQQPAINQTFQLAPTNNHTMRYVDTIEDVNKETIYYDTPFFSKDMSIVWIKNAKGEIRTYELNEIIPKDDKDIQIELLQAQINEMKGMIHNAKSNDEYVDEPVENEKPSNVPVHRTSTKKSK